MESCGPGYAASPLAQANQHIAEARQRITDQKNRVEELKRDGHDPARAERVGGRLPFAARQKVRASSLHGDWRAELRERVVEGERRTAVDP